MTKVPWNTGAMVNGVSCESAARMAVPTFAAVLGSSLLLVASAHVRILLPGTDVPMTLQPLAVLVVGLTLSPGQALSGVALYLACGTIGLPFFAAGPGGILGPTGGYLAGFALAAWVVSSLKGRGDPRLGRLTLAATVGMTIIFAVGVAWRIVWTGGNVSLAVATGLIPFIAKAVLEIAVAVTLVVAWRGRPVRRQPDQEG